MANQKRRPTINKRNRERAAEERLTLKLEVKQTRRETVRSGEPLSPSVDVD